MKDSEPDYANIKDLQQTQVPSGKYENVSIQKSPPSSSPKLENRARHLPDEPEKVGHPDKCLLKEEKSERSCSVKDGERYAKLQGRDQRTSTFNDSKLTFPKESRKTFEESRTSPTSGKKQSKAGVIVGLLALLLVTVCASVLAGLALRKASSSSTSYPLQHGTLSLELNESQGEFESRRVSRGL